MSWRHGRLFPQVYKETPVYYVQHQVDLYFITAPGIWHVVSRKESCHFFPRYCKHRERRPENEVVLPAGLFAERSQEGQGREALVPLLASSHMLSGHAQAGFHSRTPPLNTITQTHALQVIASRQAAGKAPSADFFPCMVAQFPQIRAAGAEPKCSPLATQPRTGTEQAKGLQAALRALGPGCMWTIPWRWRLRRYLHGTSGPTAFISWSTACVLKQHHFSVVQSTVNKPWWARTGSKLAQHSTPRITVSEGSTSRSQGQDTSLGTKFRRNPYISAAHLPVLPAQDQYLQLATFLLRSAHTSQAMNISFNCRVL